LLLRNIHQSFGGFDILEHPGLVKASATVAVATSLGAVRANTPLTVLVTASIRPILLTQANSLRREQDFDDLKQATAFIHSHSG
jgi:hypothetical protein